MIGMRRVVGCALAGMTGSVCMLLIAPSGSAAGLRSEPPPPPEVGKSPYSGQLLSPSPAPQSAASTGTAQITVLGPGFAICAAAHGELESSGNLSALAAGDASLAWDGAHPIPTVPLDADLGLSAILGLSQIGMPGAHQVVRRCVREAGDMGVVGGAVDTAPPEVSRPGLPARAPGESSIPLQRNPASGDQTRAGAAPASSGEAAGGSSGEVAGEAGQNQQAHEPARETTSNAVIDSSGPGSGPAPLGSVIGILLAAGAAMVVPSVIAFALQNRKGQKWVRANVRAVSSAPPAVGIQMTPQADYPWPTFGVQLALRPDSGTQSFMEVKQ